MLPDLKLYWHHVDHLDVPDARKTELIDIVHNANGDDPVQLAMTTKDAKRTLRERLVRAVLTFLRGLCVNKVEISQRAQE